MLRATRAFLRGEEIPVLQPSFENFKGSVELNGTKFTTHGVMKGKVITELPVGLWTDSFLSKLQALKLKYVSRCDDVNVHKQHTQKHPFIAAGASSTCTPLSRIYDN